MEDNYNHTTSRTVAWLGLIIAILALVLAWSAFNRSGENVGQELGDVTQEIKQQAEIAEARVRLAALKADIEAEEISDETVAEIQAIRNDLAEDFKDAEGELQQEWQQVDQQFEQLESAARENSANVVGFFEGLLESLRSDIQTDEQ